MIPPATPLTPAEIEAIYAQGAAAVVALVGALQERLAAQEQAVALVGALQERLAAQEQALATLASQMATLQERLGQNSTNSHRPPSQDGPARPPRRPRRPAGRRPGGQPGHPGHGLRFTAHPDRILLQRPAACRHCGRALADQPATVLERHQVIDLPPLALETVEYQRAACTCPACGQTTAGTFPPQAQEQLGYGPRLRALGVYLTIYQLLPVARASGLLRDLFGAGPSAASLVAAGQQAARRLRAAEAHVRRQLQAAPVLHADETGVRIGRQAAWLHVAATAGLTAYSVQRGRGRAAMLAAGVLGGFAGTTVHDCYASYQTFSCRHALCGAHLLRELEAVRAGPGQGWAGQLQRLLRRMKRVAERARARGQPAVAPEQVARYQGQYRALVAAGQARNPPAECAPGTRRRGKQSKAYNLLKRLWEQEAAVLRFLTDLGVPFDNNQAERDLRMAKLQQKIGGCFRSWGGAEGFARVRGYLSTLRKQGAGLLGALEQVFRGAPVVLCLG